MRKRNIALFAFLDIIVSAVGLFLMLNMTNPTESGPLGMLVLMVLIYSLTFGVVLLGAMLVLFIIRLIIPAKATTTAETRRYWRLRKTIAICAVLAATPMLVISLNSIGQLRFVDVLLILATELVAVFYISKKMYLP